MGYNNKIQKQKSSIVKAIPSSLPEGEVAVYSDASGQIQFFIGNKNNLPVLVNDDAIVITSIQTSAVNKPTENGFYIFTSVPSDSLPVGIALNDIAYLYNSVWYLTRNYFSSPATIKVGLENQVVYNKKSGSWASIESSIVGSASAVKFYLQAPVINSRTLPAGISQDGTSGTGIQTMTASLTPSTLAVATYSGTSNAVDTRAFASFISSTNLNVTSIPANTWSFGFWAFANNTTGASLRKGVYQVVNGTNTATVSGATANIRTVTLTSGQFSGTYFAANATNTIASHISLPSGIYQISAFISTNSVTIRVPTGYVNETAVAFNVWNLLFLTSIVAITKANAPTVQFNISHQTTVPYTTNLTDKLGIIDFAVIATANRTITVEYGGNTSVNTVITSIPFIDVNKADKVPNAFAISNLATGGAIGTALTTVDIYEKFNITQTTASQTITLPNPSAVTTNRKIVYVENSGTVAFTIYGVQLAPSTHIALIFNGTAWAPASGGSGTLPSQTVTSATATLTTFNQTVYVDAAANNVTLTLPTAIGNSGQSIEIKRIDNTSNTVRIIPNGTQTLDGQTSSGGIYLFSQNDAIVVRSNGTNSYIVSDNRGNVGQSKSYLMATLFVPQSTNLGSNDHVKFNTITSSYGDKIILDTTTSYTNAINVASIGRFRLKGGSRYKVNFQLLRMDFTGANQYCYIRNSDTGIDIEKFYLTGHVAGETTLSPSIDGRYELRIGSTSATFIIDSAYLYIEEISTPANVINTVDYLLATRNTSLNYVSNTFYIPNLIQAGSVPVDTTTGAVTLQAGKTYVLTAQMRIVGAVTQFTFYRWADFNSKAVLFSSSHGENESNNATSANSNAPIATCIYTPTVNQTVGLLFDGLPPTANTIEGFSSFILVQQIGSTAVPSNADGTVGGVKYALMNNTEVATGDTWLAGQPIYRKVIPFTNRAAGSGTVIDATLTSTYCVNVIRCYGMFKEAGGAILLIGSGSISGNTLVVNTYLFTNGLFLEVGSARSSINSGYVIIEYTKS
jgi:hypothetical protein